MVHYINDLFEDSRFPSQIVIETECSIRADYDKQHSKKRSTSETMVRGQLVCENIWY